MKSIVKRLVIQNARTLTFSTDHNQELFSEGNTKNLKFKLKQNRKYNKITSYKPQPVVKWINFPHFLLTRTYQYLIISKLNMDFYKDMPNTNQNIRKMQIIV